MHYVIYSFQTNCVENMSHTKLNCFTAVTITSQFLQKFVTPVFCEWISHNTCVSVLIHLQNISFFSNIFFLLSKRRSWRLVSLAVFVLDSPFDCGCYGVPYFVICSIFFTNFAPYTRVDLRRFTSVVIEISTECVCSIDTTPSQIIYLIKHSVR